jgi:hypothetical protein
LASTATSAGVFGAQVHTPSTWISRAQFSNACWWSEMPTGKLVGATRVLAALAAAIWKTELQPTAVIAPAPATPVSKPRRDSP